MTLENYRSMLVGAISENLLRFATGKAKSAGGGSTRATELGYTAEEIEKFTTDQEALKREIRNIQSKKSIAKSKANFNEEDQRWLQLLDDEELLKSMRDNGNSNEDPKAIKAIDVLNDVSKDIEGIDLNNLSNKDSKSLLATLIEKLKK
jgi:hypothetical protein